MTRIAFVPLVSLLFVVGCAEGGTSDSKTTGGATCDPSIAMMVTGSPSVIGSRTITKITNKSAQSVQATGASGCSSSSSICEAPAGLYAVGGSYAGQRDGVGVGALTQVGLIVGPANGQCSEDQSITVDTNAIVEMAVSTTLTSDPGSPYVLSITAIWPAS
jgi:hypothetical protein